MEAKIWHRHYDYNVPTTIRYPHLPAHELLNIPVAHYPDKAALIFYGSEMTFLELRTEAAKLANALAGLGVQKGDRVGIHLPNCPQYLVCYFAVLSIGAVVVNLNPLYTPDELKTMIGISGLETLVTFDMAIPAIRVLCGQIIIPRVIVTAMTDYVHRIPKCCARFLSLSYFKKLIKVL